MTSTTRHKVQKLSRRELAKLDAAVIQCAEGDDKQSFQLVIEQMAKAGIVVTFKQIDNSCDRLGYRWGDVFLPASRAERGHPDAAQKPGAQLATGDISERLRAIQFVPATGSPESFGEVIRSDLARWSRVARDAKIGGG